MIEAEENVWVRLQTHSDGMSIKYDDRTTIVGLVSWVASCAPMDGSWCLVSI
jgi:hypothetical protein